MKIVQMVRFATSVASTYLGPVGQIVVDLGSKALRIQDGATPGGFSTMLANNNLSDLPDISQARTNIGLGSAATHASTDFDVAGAAAAAIVTAEAYTDVETAARIAAVAAEAATRGAADTTLTNNLATEVTNRTNADTALQANITAEAASRVAGDATVVASSMQKAQNLNDVTNKATARTNLSVYSKSEIDNVQWVNLGSVGVSDNAGTPLAIGGAGNSGASLFIVSGDDGAGNAFIDTVPFSQFATNIGSLQTESGFSLGARTYTSSASSILYLVRNGGTANINVKAKAVAAG